MIKRSKLSIKWKLFIYLSAFIAGAAAILWIFETALLDGFYTFIKTRELEEAVLNTERAAKGLTDGNIEEFEYNLLYEAQRLNAQITICSEDGNLIYYAGYGAPDRRGLPSDSDGAREEDFDGNDRFLRRNKTGDRAPRADADKITRTAEVEINGEPCTISIETLIEPVSAAVTALKLILVIITAILIAAAFLLSRLLYRKLATPIIETTRSALELAEGNRDVKFNARGYSEIESLNETLDFAQKEIVKSDNLQREIIANVSHDLRTPLTLISGYAEMLRDFPGEATPENAQVIIDEAEQLTKLVNDILNLSKLNSGAAVPQTTEFSLTDMIKDIAERYGALSEKEGLKIVFEPRENIWCTADSGAISQVIYNLITNADIYGGDDRLITIEQRYSDGSAVISFSDNGGGIKEDELDSIWERYKTGSGERARGTGLGLSIAASALDLHNAEYGAKNRADGGATFWFELKDVRAEKL